MENFELNREEWCEKDFIAFKDYEKKYIGQEKDCIWEQKIVNTKLQCFGKTSFKAKEIAKQIKEGNYIEFIKNLEIENHLESLIVAFLINGIKDCVVFKNLLTKYVQTIDNWASCDTLKFGKKDYAFLYTLAQIYLKSEKPFIRRVGVNIFFQLIKKEEYVPKVFEMLNSLINESEYYVNMCASWLLAECFIKHRDASLQYFKNQKTNPFVINKAISKCRDSFRVSAEDKKMLLSFKVKM